MFGYIRPVKAELLVKDSELYSSVYCGLCRYGGKNISHLTRWMLNYDFVLLALLRVSLTDESVCVSKKRCPYRFKKKNCLCADSSYSFVSAVSGLLNYGKLQDDLRDEKGFKRFTRLLAKPVFARIAKKGDVFPGLSEIIANGLASTEKTEKENCASPDRAADGFAAMMGKTVSCGLEGDNARIGYNCGYHIGRFIFLIDALDDLREDDESKNYNPFLTCYGGLDQALEKTDSIAETLYDSLNAFSNSYSLCCDAEQNGIDRLIFNITELGGRNAVARVLERKKK